MRFRAVVAACTIAMVAVCQAPTAAAENATWNGAWLLVRFAASKTGTSLAATQAEPDFSDTYVFVTNCSANTCVSTVVDGPKPANPTLPLPPQYTWDGTRWVHIYDWQWDCWQGEGVPKTWDPARSWAYYTPQANGTLRGVWTTEIYSGPCQGTVTMDVAAFAVT